MIANIRNKIVKAVSEEKRRNMVVQVKQNLTTKVNRVKIVSLWRKGLKLGFYRVFIVTGFIYDASV